MATHYALIIGVNYYPTDRSLGGCVRDAHAVREYLSLVQPPSSVHCCVLTATSPSPVIDHDTVHFSHPPECPEQWPTHANVVASLKDIIQQVKKGDRVYFHFSGHGTVTPALPTASGSSDLNRELSLVLYESDSIGSSYLRGRHLAGAFQKLANKGALLTVVLDCCFSGSVVRHGHANTKHGDHSDDITTILRRSGARFIDYSPAIDDSTTRNHDRRVADWDHTSRTSTLDRSQTNWLLDPQGYTILTACGPYEIAHEIEVQGERRGALSYFLLTALHAFNKSMGLGTIGAVSHQSLHEHIRTKSHVSVPRQTPMRYGNTELSFFGSSVDQPTVRPEKGDVSVYRTDSGGFCLGAGEAHGVCVGDKYAAFPADWDSNSSARDSRSSSPYPVVLTVKMTRPFESNLEDIKGVLQALNMRFGWSARPMSSLSPFKIRVQLTAAISDRDRWMDAAAGLRFLDLSADDDEANTCAFQVQVTSQNEYAVVDALEMSIEGLPNIPIPGGTAAAEEEEKAVGLVLNLLQHVATFKYFENIENNLPSPSFLDSFVITSSTPGPDHRLSHGETWHLTIENRSDGPIYAAIFSFDATWEVSNIVSGSGGDDYLVIPPKGADGTVGRIVLTLLMEVPESLQRQGKSQCRDIIKVFVTSRPTAFPSILLPSLSLSGSASRTDASQGHANRLDAFLSELTSNSRDGLHHGYGEWTARNFIIHTIMAEKNDIYPDQA